MTVGSMPKINGNSLSNTINCNATNLIKGFFIKGKIDNIKEIKFEVEKAQNETENSVRSPISYAMDYTMINCLCKKITDDLLFFSFDGMNDYENPSCESYIGSLNASVLARFEIHNLFESNQGEYELTALSNNILRFASGMAGLMYLTES
jgi:hypothetical protein